eukprot:204778_1
MNFLQNATLQKLLFQTINTLLRNVMRDLSTGWDNTSYGNVWIDSNKKNKIITWTLKINRSSGDDICIGIAPTDNDMCDDFTLTCEYNYSFCTNGIFMSDGIHFPGQHVSCQQGNTVKFILDLIKCELRINSDGSDKDCVLCTSIRQAPNIKYKLAISLHYCDDSVTLINYSEKIK